MSEKRNNKGFKGFKRLLADERGNVLAFVSLSMVVLLSMTGLVIDGGMLMATRGHMQKAANAAVLSAAQQLTTTEAEVAAVASTVLLHHEEHQHLDQLAIEMERRVGVGLTREMPLGFAKLLGFDTAPVSVSARAEIGTMGQALGAAPLGIDESIPLVFNQEYKLKVDNTGVQSGYFGILALGGPGAATYEDNLRFGYQGSIKLGDLIETQTGNIAGKTRSSIAERITECPYPEGETHHRDCPRILLVPVYQPYQQTSNQLKQIKVTGFSYFYISEPMSARDTSITGKFIKRAGTGFVNADAVNRGAYAIRLTE